MKNPSDEVPLEQSPTERVSPVSGILTHLRRMRLNGDISRLP
jgi:hypothetical protein